MKIIKEERAKYWLRIEYVRAEYNETELLVSGKYKIKSNRSILDITVPDWHYGYQSLKFIDNKSLFNYQLI